MSTGSLSDVDDELLDGILKFGKDSNESAEEEEEEEEESSNCEGACATEDSRRTRRRRRRRDAAPGAKKRRTAASSGASRKAASKGGAPQEGKQVQRNAANARERARMRVLSKAFSRLKTSLPWVPADTKLSKLDTLRLASSYIAHLRQILANDKYETGFIHPVNLTWPFMVAGKPEGELKEMLNATRLCGTTAS
ncbi:transcription factor 21 [Austrofundulus limnaeus]|uniref:Transcription factor 21 n=1 Tax=Austrofundulus limnaeus TaxID=52670 RepID=A0A2I4C2Y0_AUSLI|nr:PREDICTED: transcription factor 21 [Austrofundulus limnaeus]